MSIYKGDKLVAGGGNLMTEYVRNLHAPDWSQAVLLDHKAVYADGYTAPSNGILVGYIYTVQNESVVSVLINGTEVSRAFAAPGVTSSTISSYANVQCPVNKGDLITIHTSSSSGSIAPNKLAGKLTFVPYKAQ